MGLGEEWPSLQQSRFDHLMDFDGIKCNSLEEIKQHSGIPRLHAYVEYIANSKAITEKFIHIAGVIDGEYAKLQNIFSASEIEEAIRAGQMDVAQIKQSIESFGTNIKALFESTEIKDYEINYLVNSKETYLKNNETRIISRTGNTMQSTEKKTINEMIEALQNVIFILFDADRTAAEIAEKVKEDFFSELSDKKTILEKEITDIINKVTRNSINNSREQLKSKIDNGRERYIEQISEILDGYELILKGRVTQAEAYAKTLNEKFKEIDPNLSTAVTIPSINFVFDFKSYLSIGTINIAALEEITPTLLKDSSRIGMLGAILHTIAGVIIGKEAVIKGEIKLNDDTRRRIKLNFYESGILKKVEAAIKSVIAPAYASFKTSIETELNKNKEEVVKQYQVFNNSFLESANRISSVLDDKGKQTAETLRILETERNWACSH